MKILIVFEFDLVDFLFDQKISFILIGILFFFGFMEVDHKLEL